MALSILCIIDFSESSRNAIQWAIENAQSHQSHLTILYSYRLTNVQHGENIIALKKKIEEDANKNFRALENDLLVDKPISYDFKAEVGFIADRVEEHAKKHSINSLVINKHVRESNRESFDELVDNMQVPLVIIP